MLFKYILPKYSILACYQNTVPVMFNHVALILDLYPSVHERKEHPVTTAYACAQLL